VLQDSRIFLALPFEVSGTAYAPCINGGTSIPTARKILSHMSWLLMERRLPSSSMVRRFKAFNSCLISDRPKQWPAFKRDYKLMQLVYHEKTVMSSIGFSILEKIDGLLTQMQKQIYKLL